METWNLDDSLIAETHWSCGRPMSKYKGAYPIGFLNRLNKRIGLDEKKVLTLFCGSSDYGDTVDIKREVHPTFNADCRCCLPIKDSSYDIVIADPPYDSQNIVYSDKLYNEDVVKPYSFIKESVRVLIPGGYLAILHQLVYICPDEMERYAVIPITTGPNLRIRVLNIFRKKQTLNLWETQDAQDSCRVDDKVNYCPLYKREASEMMHKKEVKG